jgi:hypothetical protein
MHDLAISILPAHLGGASSTHRPNSLRAISYCTLSESGVEEHYGNGLSGPLSSESRIGFLEEAIPSSRRTLESLFCTISEAADLH